MAIVDGIQLSDAKATLWDFIASQESGELSLDPADPGNWPSGIAGIGELRGSKWGISAAAHPDIVIADVTFAQAQDICFREYWPAAHADRLVEMGALPIAMLATDACWGSGPSAAIEALQRATRAPVDGRWGPKTENTLEAALTAKRQFNLPSALHNLVADYAAERIIYESDAKGWTRYKGGWTHRITRLMCLVHEFFPE